MSEAFETRFASSCFRRRPPLSNAWRAMKTNEACSPEHLAEAIAPQAKAPEVLDAHKRNRSNFRGDRVIWNFHSRKPGKIFQADVGTHHLYSG
jgi:hypothetical protein